MKTLLYFRKTAGVGLLFLLAAGLAPTLCAQDDDGATEAAPAVQQGLPPAPLPLPPLPPLPPAPNSNWEDAGGAWTDPAELERAKAGLRLADALHQFENEGPIKISFGGNGGSPGGSFMDSLIGLVAVVLALGFPPIFVSIILYYKYRSSRLRYQTMVTLAEKGVQIPSLDPEHDDQPEMWRDLRRGCILMGTGTGVTVFFALVGARPAMGLGLLPALIGVAYLIIYVTRRFSGDKK